jgi:glycosyltransferase involved in cell wall biosynthesis
MHLNNSQLVSIIIPTYRRPNELERCLTSLINQTYKNIQIIVINDSGLGYSRRLETMAVVSKFAKILKIEYIENEVSLGGAKSRNIGIKKTKGNYICFLDDDDEFLPSKIEAQVNYLKLNPQYQAVYCGHHIFNQGRKYDTKIYLDAGDLRLKILMLENGIAAGSTLMIVKDALNEIGGFDERFRRHQDWEFMMRFFEHYRLGVVSRPLVIINMDDSTNRNNPEVIENSKIQFLETFKDFIDKLDLNLKSEVYYKNYYELCKFFIYGGLYKKAWHYRSVAAIYRPLSIYSQIKLVGFFLDSKIPFYQKILRLRKLVST